MRTARLVGEPIGPEHLPVLVALWSDPRVTATLGGPRDEARLRADIDRRAREWEEHGYGLWVVFHAETGAPVGRGGLAQIEVDGDPEVEVGYALLPEWWGQGLATELAEASVAAAAGAGVPELVGLTLPTNAGSQRVLEKVGFTRVGSTVHGGLDHLLYRLKPSP